MNPVVSTSEDWLFLRKQAGVPTLPPHKAPLGPSLCAALLAAVPDQAAVEWPDGFGAGLVHRLDWWTSGLVIAARSLEALKRARARFASGLLVKRYRFVSPGEVPWDEHRVGHPLAHHPTNGRKMVWKRGRNTAHRGQWYEASTAFSRIDGPLWAATISTGVTHQIRLHAASVGLPLAGDRLYGGGGDGRFFLHHQSIEGWPVPTPTLAVPEDWPC